MPGHKWHANRHYLSFSSSRKKTSDAVESRASSSFRHSDEIHGKTEEKTVPRHPRTGWLVGGRRY